MKFTDHEYQKPLVHPKALEELKCHRDGWTPTSKEESKLPGRSQASGELGEAKENRGAEKKENSLVRGNSEMANGKGLDFSLHGVDSITSTDFFL